MLNAAKHQTVPYNFEDYLRVMGKSGMGNNVMPKYDTAYKDSERIHNYFEGWIVNNYKTYKTRHDRES